MSRNEQSPGAIGFVILFAALAVVAAVIFCGLGNVPPG